jgi:hypothetical protein
MAQSVSVTRPNSEYRSVSAPNAGSSPAGTSIPQHATLPCMPRKWWSHPSSAGLSSTNTFVPITWM